MSGVAVAVMVVLGLSGPLRTPDLQVEVVTSAGTPLPELAEAVSRALVAGGARVVMRGPASGACEYCAMVKVVESAPERYEVEVRHDQRRASTKLHLPAGSQLFDRARAIAIQTRLLMTWQTAPESKAKDVATRPLPRHEARESDVRATDARAADPGATRPASASSLPRPDRVPYLTARREPSAPLGSGVPLVPTSAPEPAPLVADPPAPARVEAKRTGVAEAVSAPRPEAKPAEAQPALRQPLADAAVVEAVSGRARPRWPWIPTAVGAGAAVAAGICAAVSRGHYNALGDKGQSLESARSEKSAGENWQTASLLFAGVAVAAVGTGIVGFATGSSGAGPVTAVAAPVPGGGMVALAGRLP